MIPRRRFIRAGLLGLLAKLRGQAPRRRPNVVLIVGGVWRAQSVPWAGDADIDADTNADTNAPNLAKLARQSISFTRAYSGSPRSRALFCILRGVFPHMLRGTDATVEQLVAESPSLRPLLQSAGYRTGTFGPRQANEIVSFLHALPAPGVNAPPFFVEWTFESLAGSGLIERPGAATLRLRDNVPAYAAANARTEMSTFYARAKASDREIGVALEALDGPEPSGISRAENTIVVFTSLHGEQFGSHGLSGADVAYEESVRIPLLIRYPRMIRQSGPSDILISQVDLAPTLLTWCGVTVPPSVQGRDLSKLLEGGSAAGERPEAVYAEGGLAEKDEWRMLVAGYDKLVTDIDGNATQLYNLAEDPYELTNLANVSSQQLKRDALLARQRLLMKKLEDGVDASGLKRR